MNEGGGFTVRESELVCINAPLVPVATMLKIPVSAESVVDMVRLALPDPVILGGFTVAVIPLPKPLAVRSTVPENPFSAVTLIVYVIDNP